MHEEDGLVLSNLLICCVVLASMYMVPVDIKQLVGLEDKKMKFKSRGDS